MKNQSTLASARSGVIAALYVALTFACFPVASGNMQFRLSEILTILPLFYAEAVPALFVGCLISNLLSGCVLWDVLLGSLTTLTAAIATYFTGKIFRSAVLRISLGGLFPVVLNSLFLPLIWWLAYGELSIGYWLNVCFLLISQGVIIWGMGTAFYIVFNNLLKKNVSVLKPISQEKQTK